VHDIREEYRPTVGRLAERRNSGTTAIGDPRKAARAILRISAVAAPPLRLLLGSDAYAMARAADEARIASDEEWKELTLSTDADDPEQFELAGNQTRADLLEMIEVIGAAMPDGVRVSIGCRLRRGAPEVAVTAT